MGLMPICNEAYIYVLWNVLTKSSPSPIALGNYIILCNGCVQIVVLVNLVPMYIVHTAWWPCNILSEAFFNIFGYYIMFLKRQDDFV